MLNDFENRNFSIQELPRVESIDFIPISKDYLWVSIFRFLLRYAVIFFIYFVVAFGASESTPLWLRQFLPLCLLGLMCFGFFRLYRIFKSKYYGLRDHDITYKSGWIWKRRTTIPYHRIQHCEISSGPFERMFELCTLNVYTAGGSSSDLSIPGLTNKVGQELKQHILIKMGEEKSMKEVGYGEQE